jgi:hypothetical protein
MPGTSLPGEQSRKDGEDRDEGGCADHDEPRPCFRHTRGGGQTDADLKMGPAGCQVSGEISSGVVALGRLLREAPLEDPPDGGRDVLRHPLERLGLVLDDRGEGLRCSRAAERRPACRHLVQD